MPRYIDADLMIADIQKSLCANCSIHCNPTKVKNSACEIAECLRRINDAPTADVQEVKHGRWILDKEGTELVCSVCGGFAPLNYFKYHRVRSEYCPNCGARIDCKKEE